MSTHPPRLAAWLLDQFDPIESREAIAGDLLEEYQRRGSAVWYWRQVIGTIGAGVFHYTRAHRGLALRGLMVGWLSALVTGQMVALMIPGGISLTQLRWGVDPGRAALVGSLFCVCFAISGWMMVRQQVTNRGPMILSYIALTTLVVLFALPWNSQFVPSNVLLSLLPFHLAFGLVGMPLSTLAGAALGARATAR